MKTVYYRYKETNSKRLRSGWKNLIHNGDDQSWAQKYQVRSRQRSSLQSESLFRVRVQYIKIQVAFVPASKIHRSTTCHDESFKKIESWSTTWRRRTYRCQGKDWQWVHSGQTRLSSIALIIIIINFEPEIINYELQFRASFHSPYERGRLSINLAAAYRRRGQSSLWATLYLKSNIGLVKDPLCHGSRS